MKMLSSAMSEFGISVGETFLPIVSKIVSDFLIPAVAQTNEFIKTFGGIGAMFRDSLTFIVGASGVGFFLKGADPHVIWACIAVVVLFLFADRRPSGIAERARRLVAALGDSGEAIARIAPVLIAVSLFTSLLGLTGVAPKVSGLILDMGGETLIASLAVAAIIPLVLGAPLPVTATYILSAALIAPALIRLQLDPVSVHMFLLYWATLASVTPPTCTACVIGASIAGGNWFRTSLVAMRLGIVAFLMPFFFVLNPALIARGPLFDVVTATASGLAGAVLLAAGFFGYLTSPLNLAVRGIYLVAGCLLLAPDNRLFLAGIAIALAGYGIEFFSARRRAGRPLP